MEPPALFMSQATEQKAQPSSLPQGKPFRCSPDAHNIVAAMPWS